MSTKKKFSIIYRIFLFMLCAVISLSLFAGCGGGGGKTEATVMDISIKTQPKTEYILGDAFDITGGELELLYTDETTSTIAFSAEGVTVTPPDMTTVGSKTVTVEYDGFVDTYMITVSGKTYTITYNLNYEGAPAASHAQVPDGQAITAPSEPTRTGYRFDGWYTAAQDGTLFDFSSSKADKDLTLYAAWTKVYTVTFSLNYTGAPADKLVEVEENTPVSESAAPSTLRDDFLFIGWYTAADGGEKYSFATAVTKDISLYAHWEEISSEINTYDVTFDYCYSGLADTVVRVAENDTVEKPADPTASGRTFVGWYTDEQYTSSYDFSTPVTQSITLYAKWNVTAYTIRFVYSIDGKETVYATRTVIPGLFATKIDMPEVSGYYFVKDQWYTDASFTTLFDFTKPVNDDATLYAKPLKENKFEAEFTYIDANKTGQGSSNNMTGLDIIDPDNGTAQASNGFYVSNLYYNGAFLEFVIESEAEVTDAVLMLRLTAEWEDMFIAPKDTTVNGKNYYSFVVSSAPALTDTDGNVKKDEKGYVLYDTTKEVEYDYNPIALEGAIPFDVSMYDKRPFDNHLITTQLHLYKGTNVIRLTVNNNHSHDGTIHAEAPTIDCMFIYTDVKLSWSPYTHNTDGMSL